MKLAPDAPIKVRMLGQNNTFIERAATISKVHKAKDGVHTVAALVSRDTGAPFEVDGIVMHASRPAHFDSSQVTGWLFVDEAVKQPAPARADLDAELAGLPGDWASPTEAVEDLRARYGALFTKADEDKIRDFKPTPTREMLDRALAGLPGEQKDPEYVVNGMRAFYGDLFTAEDEAKVRELVKATTA